MPQMPPSVTLDHTKVTDLSTLASASTDQATAFNGSRSAGDTVPNSVAFGIDWHAATRYRGGHAKSFIPGMALPLLADSLSWTTFTVGAMQTAANTFFTAFTSFSAGSTIIGGMVVVHYTRNHVTLVNPIVEDITSATARQNIYSQRGRRS